MIRKATPISLLPMLTRHWMARGALAAGLAATPFHAGAQGVTTTLASPGAPAVSSVGAAAVSAATSTAGAPGLAATLQMAPAPTSPSLAAPALAAGSTGSGAAPGATTSSASSPNGAAPAAALPDAQGTKAAEAAKASTTDTSAQPAGLLKVAADEVEFQRFVRAASGQTLPLFGYDLFARGVFSASQGASVPASYVLGPGDELVVQAYGLVDFSERMVLDREGRVMVPKAGPLTLSGVPLGKVEAALTAHLGRIYRNFTLSVTMGRVRSAEVFVVGQARNPGKHVVSGLSTLINALFETGGPSAAGSLRQVELRRAGQVMARIDVYRFLALGDNAGDIPLQPGDIIYIPPAGARAALLGTLNAPAIYEIKPGETIQDILNLSGGLPVLASPLKAQLERVNATKEVARYVEDFALDAVGLARPLQNADVLTVFQISPRIADVVTLQGNVASPMRYTWRKGMRIADLVANNNFLVPIRYWLEVNAGGSIGGLDRPEVNLDYAVIQRLDAKRLHTTLLPFNLSKALAGNTTENLELEAGDIVRIFGPGDAGPQAYDSVSVSASFLGGARRFVWRPGVTVRDVIPGGEWLREQLTRWVRSQGGAPLDGYAAQEINADYAVIRRLHPSGLRSELLAFNLEKALSGDAIENLALMPGDQITFYGPNEPGAETLNSVTIRGEILGGERRFVWRPGFKISDVIPNADWLVTRYNYWRRKSGQELRNDINWDYAQVIRRIEENLQTQAIEFNLGQVVLNKKPDADVLLQPGDKVALFTTREMPVPKERQVRMVTVSGEVGVPGTYQVRSGETLRSLLARAGGFTAEANVYGLDFRRESVRTSQQQQLEKIVSRIQSEAMSASQARLQNVTSAEQAQTAEAATRADQMRLALAKSELKATGRIALGLSPDKFTLPNIELEDGDKVVVPARSSFVGVFGAVNNDNAIVWTPGQTVADIVKQAGTRSLADVSETYILRADGTVLGGAQASSFFGLGGIQSERVFPGDTVVVPERADRETLYTAFIRGAKDITSIFYQFGLGAAAIKTLRN